MRYLSWHFRRLWWGMKWVNFLVLTLIFSCGVTWDWCVFGTQWCRRFRNAFCCGKKGLLFYFIYLLFSLKGGWCWLTLMLSGIPFTLFSLLVCLPQLVRTSKDYREISCEMVWRRVVGFHLMSFIWQNGFGIYFRCRVSYLMVEGFCDLVWCSLKAWILGSRLKCSCTNLLYSIALGFPLFS